MCLILRIVSLAYPALQSSSNHSCHGKEAVVDAVMQASKDGMFDLIWDEETVQDWLRDYLFEECFDDLIDIGEDDLPIAC